MSDIAELSPVGRRLEARAALLNAWHHLLGIHDHLDLNEPESLAIAKVTTLIADELESIEGRRPTRASLTDREALDLLQIKLNEPGQWNSADVCELAAQLCQRTGRRIEDEPV